ncbi:hypothetical protein BHM03_00015688 [Ensete ventricosum]|nr:hypothetical protein BHM03_00015688 [Ensete ventricosum]
MSLTSSLLCIYVDVDAIVERQMRPCQSRWWHRGKKHTLSPSEAAKQMHWHLTPTTPSSATTDSSDTRRVWPSLVISYRPNRSARIVRSACANASVECAEFRMTM